jgi:hypothetical protein
VGHVLRVKDEMVPRKTLNGVYGREKTSWKDWRKMIRYIGQGSRDAKRMLKYRNWRGSAEDRDVCKWGIGEAKTQVGL